MDVIENSPEPLGLIAEIHRVLKPGGVIFVVTPNFGSLFVHLYRLKAYGVWPDQHIVYFQPETITTLLRKAGFEKVVTGSKDFYGQNLKRLLGRKEAETDAAIKAAFGERTSLGTIRRIANRALMYIKLGDKLHAFGQKP